MRYIVKNCPEYLENGLDFCFAKNVTEAFCHNCTDCVIKQVIEKCKNQKESSCVFAVAFLADEILKLFDIEEINK